MKMRSSHLLVRLLPLAFALIMMLGVTIETINPITSEPEATER
jgi:hypothetical protein